MKDNINELPTDDYPISPSEKDVAEKYFSEIVPESNILNVDSEIKIALLIIILMILFNLPIIDAVMYNLFQEYSKYVYSMIIGLILYIVLKLKFL